MIEPPEGATDIQPGTITPGLRVSALEYRPDGERGDEIEIVPLGVPDVRADSVRVNTQLEDRGREKNCGNHREHRRESDVPGCEGAEEQWVDSVGHDQATGVEGDDDENPDNQCGYYRKEPALRGDSSAKPVAVWSPRTQQPDRSDDETNCRAADDRADEDLRGAGAVVSRAENISCGVDKPRSQNPSNQAHTPRIAGRNATCCGFFSR